MFCMAGTRAYANDWVPAPYVYNYSQPAPIVVNVPVTQTVWVPVTTVVQQPVVYYPQVVPVVRYVYYPWFPGCWIHRR